MAYVPKYKGEAAAAEAYNRGEITLEERDAGIQYQTFAQQQAEFNKRLALGETGAVARTGASFSAGDFDVHAKFFADDPNAQFIEYEGGGIKLATPEEIAALQGTPTGRPVEASGPTETSTGQLAITPAEGKEIKRTGQTVKNPETGVDVHAPEGSFYIEYTDGTVELRQNTTPGEAGETKAIGEAGPTAEELGIDRRTEIKGGAGDEVTRAPMTAAEALAAAQTPEEMNEVIKREGLVDAAQTTFLGTEYETPDGQQRVADDGNAFYQAPDGTILQRSVALQSIAKQPAQPSEVSLTGDTVSFSEDLQQGLSANGIEADNALIDSLRNDATQTNAVELYNQLMGNKGVPGAQAFADDVQQRIKDLDKEFADEQAEIDSNPWLSENLRKRKQDAAVTKFETRRGLLVNELQLQQSLIQDARQEAQFLTGLAVQEAQFNKQFDVQLLQMKFQRADQAFNNQVQMAQLDMQQQGIELQKLSLNQSAEQFRQNLELNKQQFQSTFGLQQDQFEFETGPAFEEQIRQFNVQQARLGRSGGGTQAERQQAKIEPLIPGVTSAFNALAGNDGYVSFQDYRNQKNAIVSQWGVTPDVFDAYFGGYLSPNESGGGDGGGLGSILEKYNLRG